MLKCDVVIIGAGAAGLMCAIEAAKRGRKVIILEHTNKPGKKILMAGGGRCNFTNYYIGFDKYISHNSHFCKSALSRYTQWNFISLVEKYKIEYYEKTLGQLFCVHKAQEILKMLLSECDKYNVEVKLNTEVTNLAKNGDNYQIVTNSPEKMQIKDSSVIKTDSLVIATGGLSIPTVGASPFGYKVAKQFGLSVINTKAGLVPFRLGDNMCAVLSELSGVSNDSIVSCNGVSFRENILFTHRGLSGPSILQISSYWKQGDIININLFPGKIFSDVLLTERESSSNKSLRNILYKYLPKSLVNVFLSSAKSFNIIFSQHSKQSIQSIDLKNLNIDRPIKQFNKNEIEAIADLFNNWQVKPIGTEGYRTAEVTLGGVDVNQISSKTMEARDVKNLYFIGEVLDVTGWLGGYNFQWAWSSGWVAGQYV